jgi:hypothetical protein
MKLLDILKRDLKTWPKGAAFAVQDQSGGTTVKFAGHDAAPVEVALLGSEGVWQSREWDFGTKGDFIAELADDWDTARITEDAWKGGKAAPARKTDRTRTVDEIVRDLDISRAIAVRAYKLGYRKFEIVEEDV